MGSFPLDFLRRFMRRRPARPPRLTLEEYEERIVPISSLSNYDLVWPTGGNPPTTRTSHPGNGIDINQDSDEGDTGSSDAGALVIAGHGGYATKVVNSVY
ncbi:MAG TPA: hypothetical protein VD866_28835, partial [Urbifossiella sp.]|nr:hypothetical protein [Urbifossiella sp.]